MCSCKTMEPVNSRKFAVKTDWRNFSRCFCAVAWTLLFSSCQLRTEPEIDNSVMKKIDRHRPASLEFWKTITIQGRSALDFSSFVTAMLIPTDVTISFRLVPTTEGGTTVKTRFQLKPGKSYGFGSAVPISSDGYFVTAAHCVGKQGSTIQVLTKPASPPLSLSLAHVVWRSDETNPDEPDLAILHAPIKSDLFVTLASQATLKIGTPVLTSGYGSFKKSHSGGHLQSITNPKLAPTGVTWRELTHTALTTPGDSGGPILSKERQLLGISSQIILTNPGWLPFDLGSLGYDHGVCFVPDAQWLNSIIQRHRSKRQ